jgi:peptidoglycan/xylan/chitin deacetylase (PgdA/CDA1 family)
MAISLLVIGLFVVFTLTYNVKANTVQTEHSSPSKYIRQANLLVLMYHDMSLEPPEDAERIALATTAEKLAADIDALLELGYKPISLEDYYHGLAELGQKYFVISFDDGYKGVYDIAYPVLLEKQAPACIFFNTGMEWHATFLKYEQLQDMEASGLVKVYTHLSYHMKATEMPIEEFTNYTDASIHELNRHLGEKPMFLAYPYGVYNKETYQVALEHGIRLQLAQKMLFPAADILLRVNVPYDADMKKLVKKAPHN